MKRNENGNFVVGIDLGGTTVTSSVVDREGNLLSEAEIPSYSEKGVDVTTDKIAESVEEAIKQAGKAREDVIACGMGAPGIHKADEGVVLWSPNFSGWDGANVYEPLRKKTGFEFYMGNDVNVASFGEYTFGAGRGAEIMVMFTLGTGVGSGLIVRGEAYRGMFASPELGHVIIDAKGPRCGCGRYGCVEALCNRDAIINRAMQKVLSGRKSKLYEATEGRLTEITPQMIDRFANEKDIVCCETLCETGFYMGLAVANTINSFDPSLIVIGGGIARSRILFEEIKKTAMETAIDCLKEHCSIVPSQLGNKAGILGGAALAFKGVYA
ncbi:MAG: ROK family protein [Abditibacteriota bacterium]|nr:ROK family protein [Abditibacteriota bacterium]